MAKHVGEFPEPLTQPPTAAFIVALAEDGRSRFAARDSRMDLARRHRHRKVDPPIPDEYTKTAVKVKTPTYGDVVSQVTSMLTQNGAIPKATPYGDREKDDDLPSRIERFIDGQRIQFERKADDPQLQMAFDTAVEVGGACEKVILKPEIWGDYPEPEWERGLEEGEKAPKPTKAQQKTHDGVVRDYVREKGLPIQVVRVDPKNVWWFRDQVGLAMLIEAGDVDKRAAARMYNLEAESFGDHKLTKRVTEAEGFVVTRDIDESQYSGIVKELHFWDREWYAHVVDGAVVDLFAHHYGEIPYFFSWGIRTSSYNPDEMSYGAADSLLALVPIIDSLLTMYYNVAHMVGYPTPFQETDIQSKVQVGIDGRPPKIDIVAGEMVNLVKGTKITFPLADAAKGADMILNMVSILKGYGDESTVAPVLKGQSGSELTGFLATQLMTSGTSIFKPIAGSKAEQEARKWTFILKMIRDIIAEPVAVLYEGGKPDKDGRRKLKWVTLSPEDLSPIPRLEFIIKPALPANIIAEGTFAAAMHREGHVDEEWVHDRLEITDSAAMKRRRREEDIRKFPPAVEFAYNMAVAELGLNEPLARVTGEATKAATAQKEGAEQIRQAGNASGGVPPPSGAGQPAGPVPGGTDSATLVTSQNTPRPTATGKAFAPDASGAGNEGIQG